MTRTITLSDAAFNEIADEMIKTGHEDAIILGLDHSVTLDMHGLCLLRKASNVIESLPDVLKGFE
jgi:hypothetical protein